MNGFVQLPRLEDLPMPLTDIDQSSFDWHKHPHTKILLNARIRALKADRKGMLWMLMEHAALEVPFASLPNDHERMAEMAGVTLKTWHKASDAVLGAGFVLCDDNRWYCKMLADVLTPTNTDDAERPAPKAKLKKPVDPALSEKRSQAGQKGKQAQMAKQANPEFCQDEDLAKSGKTLAKAEFCQNDDLAKSGKTLANGGIKGGDKDLEKELDLDKKQTHSSESPEKSGGKFLDESKEIFDFWKKTFEKSDRTVFDNRRKTKVIARLKDGYSVNQLKQAITGCASSEYHVENHHIDLELICRDATHTDRFIGLATAPKKPKPTTQDGKVNQYWQDQRKGIENDGLGRRLTPEEQEAFRQKTIAEGFF